jgi:hypothetical protein
LAARRRLLVALDLADVARRLRDVIVALDRRVARPDAAAEPTIAREAATRLAEISMQTRSVSAERPDRADRPGTDTMTQTPFPATPADVAVLTVREFTVDLDEFDGTGIPSMERICRTFMDDANRALVWWIRFGALQAWRTNPDVIARSGSDSGILRDACKVAAGFPLNPQWEFDATAFGRTLDGMAPKRARAGDGR